MAKKPTYEELELRGKELEKEVAMFKRADEALAESEEKYRTLVDQAPIGVIQTSGSTGEIFLVNNAALRIFEFDSEEEFVAERSPTRWKYAKERERFIQLLREHEEVKGFEAEALTKHDRIKTVIISSKVDGDLILSTILDITERRQAQDALQRAHDELERRVEERTAELVAANKQLRAEIEDRKQAQEALRASEEKYRTSDVHLTALLENTDDYILISDSKGLPVMFNSAYTRIMKKTLGIDMRPGLQPHKLLPDKKVIAWWDNLHRRVLSGEKFREEYSHEFDKEDIRYFEISYHPITKNDEVTGFSELTRDITSRKLAEEALRQSEKKYRTILESIEDGYFEVDIRGDFTFFNDSLCEIHGYTKDEMMGMNNRQYMDQHTAKKVYQTFNKVYTTGKPVKGFDYEIIRKGSATRNNEVSVSLIEDSEGQPLGFRGIVRDVTQRKQMEAELLQTKNFLQNILDSSIDGITTTDLHGTIVYTSSKVKDILGYEPKEDIGKKIYTFYGNGKEDAKTIMNELTSKGELRNHEMGFIKKDGELIDVSLSASLLKDEKGEVIGTLGIYRDITEKKRLEDQLQRAQKMEALGTLAGGVAHDLNNILSGLVSYPDLLLMQLPEDSPLKKPILTIQESGQKAAAVVQDLLTLARRGVATMEVVNLNEIISQYLKSPECGKLRSFHPNVELKTDLKGDLLNISGSKVHLAKTVMNLVSNAAEAMTEGGKIMVSTESRYIDRPISGYDEVEEGDYVVLTVSDTGVGIPTEDSERIFEPFYTKKKMGRSATGLGMAVVWGTVKDHNGYIDLQSTEGKGTTFTLYFPVTRKELAKDKAPVSIKDYMGKGESILVVDDVKEQRDIASSILSELGYSVSSVSSGEEAVEYLKNYSADLLLLDMIMDPGIDGLDTYKKILELHPGQKAIIASGFSETKRVKQARKLGAGRYIRKPYTMEKIGMAVKTELEE